MQILERLWHGSLKLKERRAVQDKSHLERLQRLCDTEEKLMIELFAEGQDE